MPLPLLLIPAGIAGAKLVAVILGSVAGGVAVGGATAGGVGFLVHKHFADKDKEALEKEIETRVKVEAELRKLTESVNIKSEKELENELHSINALRDQLNDRFNIGDEKIIRLVQAMIALKNKLNSVCSEKSTNDNLSTLIDDLLSNLEKNNSSTKVESIAASSSMLLNNLRMQVYNDRDIRDSVIECLEEEMMKFKAQLKSGTKKSVDNIASSSESAILSQENISAALTQQGLFRKSANQRDFSPAPVLRVSGETTKFRA